MYYPFYIIYLHVLPTLDSIPQIKLNTTGSNFDLPKIRIQRSTCTTINLARSARQVTKEIYGVVRVLPTLSSIP